MLNKVISSILTFRAVLQMPPDKSISHRALMLGALAKGPSIIYNLSVADDVRSTQSCLSALGVDFTVQGEVLTVQGVGAEGLREPAGALDCGNSGTTMRLLAGILAGSKVSATLTGDESLQKRPMQRVVKPLLAMGGDLSTVEGRPPLDIRGRNLHSLAWLTEVASAQVKSSILLAGLTCAGKTRVAELYPTRDHTERMLKAFGAKIAYGPAWAEIEGSNIVPFKFRVPGDVSAAAFFVVLAACLPQASLRIEGVGLNPGRTGFLEVLRDMGASVHWEVETEDPEPTGSIEVRGGRLQGFSIAKDLVPRVIDELPVLAVAAACAEGRSVVRDAAELRFKESDRIRALLGELNKLGVRTEEYADGFAITGGRMMGAAVNSQGDHRLAMALAVAGALAGGSTTIHGAESVAVSYPNFWDDFACKLRGAQL